MRPQDKARQLRPYIEKSVESLSDTDALNAVELFEEWAVGITYPQYKRIRHNGVLYKVKQGHTSQADWPPEIATSLYEEVAEPGAGTKDNPIPYNNNMELKEGLYYIQYDRKYYCFRSTGIAVYSDLFTLVDIYVNEVIE